MAGENDTTPLWMRSVATVYDGRVEDFKDLVRETLRSIREKDSQTCIFSAFLDETSRAAVFIEEYANSAGWLAHRTNLHPLLSRYPEVCEFTEVEVYGDPTSEARDALRDVGSPVTYYPSLSAL